MLCVHHWRLPLLGVLTLALLLCCGAQGQAQELSQSRIWNSVLDRVNLKLLFAPVSLADAQGAELSITTILNLVLVPATETESAYLRTNAGGGEAGSVGPTELESTAVTPGPYGSATQSPTFTVDADGRLTAAADVPIAIGPAELASTAVTPGICGSATEVCQPTFDADGRATLATTVPILATTVVDELPAMPCTVNAEITLLPDVIKYMCIEEDALDENDNRCDDATLCWYGVGNPSTGSIPDFTPTVNTLRYRPLSQTDVCVLDTNSVNIISAASSGTTTCVLPAASDDSASGFFHIINTSAYGLTLDTTGSDVINPGALNTLGPIVGPGASFTCYVETATSWNCSHVISSGYGEPWTLLCSGVNGSTNSSATGSGAYVAHNNLTCEIPANTLTTGSVLRTCAAFELITGSASPNLSAIFTMNGVKFSGPSATGWTPSNNISARSTEFCAKSVVEDAPSATSSVWSSLLGDNVSLNTNNSSNTAASTLDWPTNAPVTLGVSSEWVTAGTGTNTYRLLLFTVEGAGLQ